MVNTILKKRTLEYVILVILVAFLIVIITMTILLVRCQKQQHQERSGNGCDDCETCASSGTAQICCPSGQIPYITDGSAGCQAGPSKKK